MRSLDCCDSLISVVASALARLELVTALHFVPGIDHRLSSNTNSTTSTIRWCAEHVLESPWRFFRWPSTRSYVRNLA
jgi:hypothetical protein